MRASILALVVVALLSSMVIAQEAPAPFKGKVVTVSVFKNGYGFFRMEGSADAKDGKVELSPVPAAALGTWWFYVRKDGTAIDQAIAAQREVNKSRAPLSLDELLSANTGKTATIETEKGKYTGVILANSAVTTRPPASVPFQPRYDNNGSMLPPEPQVYYSSSFLLKTPEGLTAVRPSDVKTVIITDTAGVAEFSEKKKEGYVTLYVKGAAGPTPIGCQFLEKGIRWIPSYRVELVDDKNASLVLQGEVINDVHDLDGSTLQLVVGIPNFMSGELLSPLAYVSEMPKLSVFFQPPSGQGGGRGGSAGYYSNAMASQSISMGRWQAEAIDFLPAPIPADFTVAPAVTSRGVADLYYYTKENVTLKSGERASLNVLSATVPYRDIYKWNVVDKTVQNRSDYRDILRRLANGEFSYSGNMTPDVAAKLAEITRQDIAEHYVRLTNSTDKPLTSGPTLLFAKGDILSQDLLNYTPAGGTVDVKITGAPDIKVSQREQEASRTRNALNSYGYNYDLVNANVLLTVKNFKKEPVHMVVTKPFDGTVIEAPKDGATTSDTSELTSINPHSRVEWEFDLDSGASKELTFSYSTYVRQQ